MLKTLLAAFAAIFLAGCATSVTKKLPDGYITDHRALAHVLNYQTIGCVDESTIDELVFIRANYGSIYYYTYGQAKIKEEKCFLSPENTSSIIAVKADPFHEDEMNTCHYTIMDTPSGELYSFWCHQDGKVDPSAARKEQLRQRGDLLEVKLGHEWLSASFG